jgi:hypothetical protein
MTCVNENRPRCVPVPLALVAIVAGGVTVSLPWNVPLKGTWRAAAAETASGDNVEGAPIDADVEAASMDDGTDVGLVGGED